MKSLKKMNQSRTRNRITRFEEELEEELKHNSKNIEDYNIE